MDRNSIVVDRRSPRSYGKGFPVEPTSDWSFKTHPLTAQKQKIEKGTLKMCAMEIFTLMGKFCVKFEEIFRISRDFFGNLCGKFG